MDAFFVGLDQHYPDPEDADFEAKIEAWTECGHSIIRLMAEDADRRRIKVVQAQAMESK